MDLSHPLSYWLANDIILANGQKGLIVDIGWYKVGDGVNPFSGLKLNGLDYINLWFSNWGPEENKGSALCSIYHNTLIGGSLVQQGGWIEFSFELMVANNANAKNIYLKFANKLLIDISIVINQAMIISIKGKIKLLDYVGKKAFYILEMSNPNSNYQVASGVLTDIDFAANNVLLIQVQGAANGDIICNGGDGKICVVSRF